MTSRDLRVVKKILRDVYSVALLSHEMEVLPFLIWCAEIALDERTRTPEVSAALRNHFVPAVSRAEQAWRDEDSAVARSISIFHDAMRRNVELKNTVMSDAEARTQQQERISAEIGQFGAEIEMSLSELGLLFEHMLAASSKLTEVADLASSKTASAATASDEATANAREIAAVAEELASSVNEIDVQVAHSHAITAKAVSKIAHINDAVKELDEAGRHIGDVIRLITDIARRTNLLALNATIEAARAGEAGRGFAVVASEVKALSSQTAKATDEIGAQIAAMQSATQRSIKAITGIELIIREIGEISGAITSAVNEQGAAIQQIARGAEVAVRHTNDTAAEVVQVGEATENAWSSAKSVNVLADNLAANAAKIRSQVDQFFRKLARHDASYGCRRIWLW